MPCAAACRHVPGGRVLRHHTCHSGKIDKQKARTEHVAGLRHAWLDGCVTWRLSEGRRPATGGKGATMCDFDRENELDVPEKRKKGQLGYPRNVSRLCVSRVRGRLILLDRTGLLCFVSVPREGRLVEGCAVQSTPPGRRERHNAPLFLCS
ncbi:uncharacterized protein B0I36DRAFT_333972 [Microdochium trichocladiopsis]|uniref:Uncharacterized protein n=1 Tax=Microdochium trichocladiopsis TaxID=1682393 RepID=A0A9P9BNT5_9PEZI|nr:uncharacterized protein B0I36DRAFT_333972 [Microdochium trichocladiopsis]KAH7021193.1 hypothetical protein B0I36DRAFT_333972 [Microdochium trichocladiopsis]